MLLLNSKSYEFTAVLGVRNFDRQEMSLKYLPQMTTLCKYCSIAAFLMLTLPATVAAQFNTVIEYPRDAPLSCSGISLGSNTQLNVFDDAEICDFFEIGASDGSGTNVEVNFNGGIVRGGTSTQVNAGSTLNINGGIILAAAQFDNGRLDSPFQAQAGSIVNIEGGTVESLTPNAGSSININGGFVNDLVVGPGSDVDITGGSFSFVTVFENDIDVTTDGGFDSFFADAGSTANIADGRFAISLSASNSVVNFSGGELSSRLNGGPGSTINVTGGRLSSFLEFNFFDDSTLNLVGSDFAIDDVPLVLATSGEAFEILDRDVTLSGVLSDGSNFRFDVAAGDFPSDARVRVALAVPEPSATSFLALGWCALLLRRKRNN